MKEPWKYLRLLSLALTCLLLLVACQPDDGPEIEEAAPTAEPEAEVAETDEAVVDERREEEFVDEEPCTLSMGWDPWEPYHFMGTTGAVEGLDIEIASAMADVVGCDLEFVQGNWASLLRQIQQGELDFLGGATRTSERERFAWFTQPYRNEQFQLFVYADQSDEFSGETLEELLEDGFRLGVTQGFIYSEEVSELQGDPRFEDQFIEAPLGDLHFARLQDQMIDGFLEDPFVAAAIERRRGWENDVETHPIEFPVGDVHFMFSRESVSEDRVEAFDEALGTIRESGRYQEILDQYGN